MEITGTISKILPIKNGTSKAGKEWTKQEFVIETGGQYPKQVCISDFNGKLHLDGFAEGEEVVVSIELESREWKDKYFTEVKGWKLQRVGQKASGAAPVYPEPIGKDESGLPF